MAKGKFTSYTLNNVNGMQIQLLNYGATLTSVKIPDQNNHPTELILGFDDPEEYVQHPFYFGCTVGRVANRIAHGAFNLQNQLVELARNEKNFCHLHGGKIGFDKIFWQGKHVANGVEFSYYSPAGEEGYPGNLQVIVTYVLTPANELKMTYLAQTDAPTPVNLTNHTYWNLAGAGNGNVLNHEMEIFAEYYLETDAQHLPTGNILPVAESAFDFRTPHTIGERLSAAAGYDHCYVLSKNRLVSRVQEPASKRILETYTTQPGMQFYSGNYLCDYAIANGKRTEQWGGFCLETQGYPDAPNQPDFPSVILMPGEFYTYETVYKLIF